MRNTPARRSTGILENQMEYFVPRSISEFNLSGVGDLALPPPRRTPAGLSGPHNTIHQSNNLLMQPQTILLPASGQIILKPQREKMVTFEDESKTCPHGMPTTPRKTAGIVVGADVFM